MSSTAPSPPSSSIVQPLLTDLYQVSMAYAYWHAGRHCALATFDLYFRSCPFDGHFVAFAGLGDVISFLQDYRFTQRDIAYIRSVLPHGDDAFFSTYLPSLSTSALTLRARAEGSIALPNVPLLSLSGPLALVQLLESTVLNLVGYPSLLTTNAARIRLAAGPTPKLVEFGLRRAQGPDGALRASRYAYLGLFDGTSNLLAGRDHAIPVYGTHAHSFVQSFAARDVPQTPFAARVLAIRAAILPSSDAAPARAHDGEVAAFIVYATAFPRSFLALVDTYDTLGSGVPNFVAVALALIEDGAAPVGIRLDSGDLAALSWRARQMFRDLAERYVVVFGATPGVAHFAQRLQIMASDDLNEEKLRRFRSVRHSLDAFGIGTELVTCRAQPALGCVFKLAEMGGEARMKFSEDEGKMSLPGAKDCWRLFEEDGEGREVFIADILTRAADDTRPVAGEDFRYVGEAVLRAALGKDGVSVDESALSHVVKPTRVEELLVEVWSEEAGGLVGGLRDYGTPQYVMKCREHLRKELNKMIDTSGEEGFDARLDGAVGLAMPLAALIVDMHRRA